MLGGTVVFVAVVVTCGVTTGATVVVCGVTTGCAEVVTDAAVVVTATCL